MQITLNQTEIELAIVDYVKSQGISMNGCDIDVQLKAGRAGNENTATVDITKSKLVETAPVITHRAVTAETVVAKEDVSNFQSEKASSIDGEIAEEHDALEAEVDALEEEDEPSTKKGPFASRKQA